MSYSSPDYDSDNRFTRCVMEHKMIQKGLNPDNRFEQCASISYLEKEREFISNRNSIPIREKRSDSNTSSNSEKQQQKYPNSRLRSKTSVQDVRSTESSPCLTPTKKTDTFEDNFPCLSHSPKTNCLNLNQNSPKTPVMIPLRSPKLDTSPKKIVVDSVTSISVKGGKLVQKEILTVVEEPPPLVITPSKWSDLLRTSAK
jgi:hypothetical protein